MGLDKKDILKLANLAKLSLTSEEVEQYQQQLKEVLDYVDKLKELNLSTIEASLTGIGHGQHQLRNDEASDSTPSVIKQAVNLQEGYVVSPAVFKK